MNVKEQLNNWACPHFSSYSFSKFSKFSVTICSLGRKSDWYITVAGKPINMNNIGRTLPEKARKSIDKKFQLISPESKKLSKQVQQKRKAEKWADFDSCQPLKSAI